MRKKEILKFKESKVLGNGEMFNIITTLYRYTYIVKFLNFKLEKYKIKQYIPYIEHPFYDWEYSINRKLKNEAFVEYQYMNVEMLKIKNNEI